MTKQEIIEELAKKKEFETLIDNITKGHGGDYVEDLAQDLYISLMTKPEPLIQHLYEKKQLKWFMVRMCLNNIKSLNSPYFTEYIKYDLLKSENGVPDLIDEEDEI